MGLDLSVESGDVTGDHIDAAQHLGEQERMMLIEVPAERFLEQANLGAHPGPRQLGEHLGIAFPGDQSGHHRPPGHPEHVRGHDRELDAGILHQLVDSVLLRGPSTDLTDAIAGQVPQSPDRFGWHETGAQHLMFATLHNQTASSTSVLGRPGRCFTSRALTSQGCSPWASNR